MNRLIAQNRAAVPSASPMPFAAMLSETGSVNSNAYRLTVRHSSGIAIETTLINRKVNLPPAGPTASRFRKAQDRLPL